MAGTQEMDWISEGEKFALIGLNVHVDPNLDRLDLPGGQFVLSKAEFKLPEYWREWLGTLLVEKLEETSLFLLAKICSEEPSILNGENQFLQGRINDLFTGLTLTSKFTAFDDPFTASGARSNGKIDVRSFSVLASPLGMIVTDTSPVGEEGLREAARIGSRLNTFDGPWRPDHWRILRCLHIYQNARCDRDILNRVHQFVRCLEGLIAPEQGKTRKRFQSRTELFIGPRHHDLMGKLYDARSDIEHLHENRYLAQFDRETRIQIAKFETISEWVARDCLKRILLNQDLLRHFGNVDTIEKFWKESPEDRRKLWGEPIDPLAPLNGFRFDSVSDTELGARHINNER